MATTIDRGTLTVDAGSEGAKPTWSFPMIESLMKSLPPIEEIWAGLPDVEAITRLQEREELLGVATLSCRSFELLHEIITNANIRNVIRRHPPSVTAAAKQTVLDAGLHGVKVLVNKTVTVRLGTLHLLCTGAGDFTMNRTVISEVANKLHLPKRVTKDCRINPADYSPEYELGLLTGMVSPFFPPTRSRRRLRALVLMKAPEVGAADDHMVAISCSPFESLVVPLVDFGGLTELYARRAYPDLQWAIID